MSDSELTSIYMTKGIISQGQSWVVITTRLGHGLPCCVRTNTHQVLVVNGLGTGFAYPCLLLAFSRLARDSASLQAWAELPTLT